MIWRLPHHSLLSRQVVFFFWAIFRVAGPAYWREKGRGGGGAKSEDGKKGWSSINHSLLSSIVWCRGGKHILKGQSKRMIRQAVWGLTVCDKYTQRYESAVERQSIWVVFDSLVKSIPLPSSPIPISSTPWSRRKQNDKKSMLSVG